WPRDLFRGSWRPPHQPHRIRQITTRRTFRRISMPWRSIAMLLLTLSVAAPVTAQLADELSLPRPANCCLAGAATQLAEQLQDWNQLGRYHEANGALHGKPEEPGRVVFMGDSITDGWALEASFPGKPYVNRGISGQTTAQMLVRMYPDVIALAPAAVIILAGT